MSSTDNNSAANWVAEVTGATNISIVPLAEPGMSRAILLVTGTLRDGTALDALIKQESGRGPFYDTPFGLRREAEVMRTAARAGVPVPRILAVSDDESCFLMERLRGSAASHFRDAAEERSVRASYLKNLSALHAASVSAFPLPFSGAPDSRQAILSDMEDFCQIYERFCPRDATIEAAFVWMKDNVPQNLESPSLLHGDAGPGNFMHENGGVTGFIDWEMAHLGDPADDLAWLWFRKKVLRQDADLGDWYDEYSIYSGRPFDAGKVAYFRVAVLIRTSIAARMIQVRNPDRDLEMADIVVGLLGLALQERNGADVGASIPPLR